MSDLTLTQPLNASLNHGSVAIEQQRAVAEAQGKLTIAKSFPRNINQATQELLEACRIPALASQAFYSVPRKGGRPDTGASIRLAEEIARIWGNLDYGHRELSRGDGKSEVEVYAWDMQTNTFSRRQVTVMHSRYTTAYGNQPLKDPRDIDNLISNVSAKHKRACILAIIPKWLKEMAEQECKLTLSGNNTIPLAQIIRNVVADFSRFGVTLEQIEDYFGKESELFDQDDLHELTGIINALRDGSKPKDFFGKGEDVPKQEPQKPTPSDAQFAKLLQCASQGDLDKIEKAKTYYLLTDEQLQKLDTELAFSMGSNNAD